MKYLLLLLMVSSLSSNGQIEKTEMTKWTIFSEVKSVGSFIASMKYTVEGKDTTFIVLFRNGNYTHITDIQSFMFREEGGVLNSLYQILLETLDSENGKQNSFKLGEQDLIATCVKVIGMKAVNIRLLKNGAWFGLTKKQLDKLFNKKN